MQMRPHILVLHGCTSQWGINAVQFGGVDLPLAVFVLCDGNLPVFDRPQDRGLVPADRRSGCCDGMHGVLLTVLMSRYGATAPVNKTFLGQACDPQVRNLQFLSSRSHVLAGFIVTIYDEDGLRLAATLPC
jgi:hypothetical protein